MVTESNLDEATDVLQQLGLKEYEAKCFVGLSRMSSGTAKQLSEIVDVPRTRIYDAIRVLEAQGLVEVQHSSPQQFRAVSIEEATETLRDQYESRVDRLQSALSQAEPIESDDESSIQEVWSMSGSDAIANRTSQLVEDASEEIVLVVGDESVLTGALVDTLNDVDDEVDLFVGAVSESVEARIEDLVPRAETFVSGLEWLHGEAESETAIGRLLLVDRSIILVSSVVPETGDEHAIFARGLRNGLVVISRRLMAQGLLTGRNPAE